MIKRKDMFIVTKLWNTFHEPHLVEKAFNMSLNNLQVDYIDLYLIHFPFGYEYKNDHEQWPKNRDGSRALRYNINELFRQNIDFNFNFNAFLMMVSSVM